MSDSFKTTLIAVSVALWSTVSFPSGTNIIPAAGETAIVSMAASSEISPTKATRIDNNQLPMATKTSKQAREKIRIPDSALVSSNSGITIEIRSVSVEFAPSKLKTATGAGSGSMILTLELGLSNKLNNSFYEITCPEDQFWLIADRMTKISLRRRQEKRLKPLRVPAGGSSTINLSFALEDAFMSLEFMMVDTEWGDISLPLMTVGDKKTPRSPSFEFKPLSLSGFTFGIVSLSRLRNATPTTASEKSGTTIRLSIKNDHKVPRILDSTGLTSMGVNPADLIPGILVCGPQAHPASPHGECQESGGNCQHIYLLPGISEVFRFDFPGLDPKDPRVFSIRGEFGSILQNLERP